MSRAVILTEIVGDILKLTTTETAASRDVGFGIGFVKSGTDVTCPTLLRMEGMKPGAGVFLLARI
jgi:hypothetical protein